MELYFKNLQSIKDQTLKKQLLSNGHYNSTDLEVEESKKGALTLKKNDCYLYSKYDPIKETAQFIDSQINDLAHTYCVFGFGLGYHVEQLTVKEPLDRKSVV